MIEVIFRSKNYRCRSSGTAIFDMTSRNTVCSNIKILEDQPLKQILEDVYKLPAFVYNESNLCVVSKQKNEVSSGNIAYILCSEGLGTGVIANGCVITGYMGYAAEVCHILLVIIPNLRIMYKLGVYSRCLYCFFCTTINKFL